MHTLLLHISLLQKEVSMKLYSYSYMVCHKENKMKSTGLQSYFINTILVQCLSSASCNNNVLVIPRMSMVSLLLQRSKYGILVITETDQIR